MYCLLITTMFVLASCMEKDIYDPNYSPEFGVSVPENFSWSTTKSLTVNVEVNDEYNGKYYYAVRVYDKDPASAANVLPIAALAKVNKDLSFSQKIVIPATVSKLYIAQVFKNADASEKVVTQEVAISGDVVAYSFGSAKSRSAVATRGNGNATTITVESGKTYQVDSKDLDSENITVENGGTLHFINSIILTKCDIYIKDGGKMTAAAGTTLTFDKNSELHNYGEVRIHDIEFWNGATLHNGDAVEGENSGACLYAENIMLVNGHGGDKRYLGERSYTSCKKLILDNVKLTLEASAWLKCDVLDTQKEKGGASTLLASGQIVGSNYSALAMIGKIVGALTIDEQVLVECNDTKNADIKGDVVSDAAGKITIIGTTCSEGGFGVVEKTELGAYTYIMEDMFPIEGDYDMNDLVVSLSAIQTGTILKISGELKAVGATSKIVPYIKVGDDTQSLFVGEQETHAALAGSEIRVPINTEVGGLSYPSKAFELQFTDVKQGLNIDDIDFYIVVDNQTVIHGNTHKDKNAWGMRVPGFDFKWAQEKVKISVAYPEFNKWFSDATYDWYNKYDSSKIYGK